MKRFILILILILIAVYATLSFFGAGDENVAERLFYRTMQTHQKIVQNPDVAPPQMVAEVENNMQKIIKDFPKAKTAKSAYSVLSEFFLMNKKYDQALLLLDEIINKYPEDTSLASKAQFFKGIVYERQGLWEEALQEYIILRDKYISTPLGLQVPFYIGYYYSQKGSLNKADQAYREAAIFYADLESKYRGKVLGYAAASFLLQTRLNLKE